MALGGARPGAGRKRKSDKNAGAVEKAEKQIRDHLPEIVDAQITLALGVTVQEVDPENGGLIVYTKAPDRTAGQYLINRIMGKVTERLDITINPPKPLDQMTEDELAEYEQKLRASAK